MAKSVNTIILICSNRVARMDFTDSAAKKAIRHWQALRPAGQPIAESVEFAIASLEGCGRNVWVLCEDLWTQSLSVSSAAVAGLSPQHVSQVLAFELESLSGLGAMDSQVGFLACGLEAGRQSYWVTQVAAEDCSQIERMIRLAGGRLRGLCHPAGLPAGLGQAARASWRRLEAWGDVTLCLAGNGNGASVHFVSPGVTAAKWRQEVTQWLGSTSGGGPVEVLYRWRLPADDLCEGLPEMAPVGQLEGETLDRWLALWAAALAGRTAEVPMIRPPAQPMTPRRRVALSAAIAAAVLVGCLVHHGWFTHHVSSLQVQAEQADRPRREMADVVRKSSPLEAKLKQLDPNANVTVVDPLVELARQKERIPSLLSALARLTDEDRVVTRLSAESRGGVTGEGVCLRPELADLLAVGLGQELGGRCWLVGGAQKRARLAAADGGPWDFRVTLTPQTASASPSPSPSAAAVAAGGVK